MIGLVSYLFGPGRANEHEKQHIIAGSGDIAGADFYGGRSLTRDEVVWVGRLLDMDRVEHGVDMRGKRSQWDYERGEMVATGDGPNHVWHCSLSLRPDEAALSDEAWEKIAAEFVTEMGFIGEGKAPCRWVAVRHGESKNGGDHVHIAVNLVREDGSIARTWNDYANSQRIANVLERRHGLEVLESREHDRGSRGITPREQAQAVRDGERFSERERLEIRMRAALVAATNESEYVAELRSQGVLVRPRYAKGSTDHVEGYSVALRGEHSRKPVWFGGGRIARDLTLSRLRDGWDSTSESRRDAVAQWQNLKAPTSSAWIDDETAVWKDLARAVDETLARLDAVPLGDDQGLAQCARDASGLFASLAQNHEGSHGWQLATAAQSIGRIAQTKTRPTRIYRGPSPALRNAALLLRSPYARSGRMSAVTAYRQMSRLGENLARTLEYHGQANTARRTRHEIEVALASQVGAFSSADTSATVSGTRTQNRRGDMRRFTDTFGPVKQTTKKSSNGLPQRQTPPDSPKRTREPQR